MPEIGEIKNGRHIGYRSSNRFMWTPCSNCGKERWVILIRHKPMNDYCPNCATKALVETGRLRGPKSPSWKGGHRVKGNGYVYVWIDPADFFYPMADKKRNSILEHRLVMARHLGRCLQSWEYVHHKNGVKSDNRPENLELTSGIAEHSRAHSKGYSDGYQKGLQDGRLEQIQELKQEIRLLRLEIRQVKGEQCPKV